jgi:uncharacterized LabA/DUF88 family protein
MLTHIGFVDAGFLKAEAARALRLPYYRVSPNAAGCVAWLERFGQRRESFSHLTATYWYDAAWGANHRRRGDGEERYFRAIARTRTLRLRLGRLSERRPRWQRELKAALRACEVDLARFEREMPLHPVVAQKGVDALLAIDLVTLSAERAFDAAVLISGDADHLPALERVKESGRRVVLAYPHGAEASVAAELTTLADEVFELDRQATKELLIVRPERLDRAR